MDAPSRQAVRPESRAEAGALIDEALGEGLRTLYQPIVDLERDETVAYEALGRGPAGGPLESPETLLATARLAGRLGEVDWELRASAIAGALEAGLGTDVKLFVNVEPGAHAPDPPPRMLELARRAVHELRIVAELTERDLASSPGELLRTIDRLRSMRIGVAIDDVGDNPRALSLLPLVRPDVVKLRMPDLMGDPERASTLLSGVDAYAEREGIDLILEQIETDAQRELTQGLGIGFGQGFLLGRPSALPAEITPPARGIRLGNRPPATPILSPFDFCSRSARARTGREERVAVVIRHLIERARVLGPDCSLVVNSPGAIGGVDPIAEAAAVAPDVALVCVAAGDGRAPNGCQALEIADDGPLAEEWVVVLTGAYSVTSICVRRAEPGSVRFVVTHRVELATDVARAVFESSSARAVSSP